MATTRREFAGAIASAAIAQETIGPGPLRPNIVFLMPDQHRYHSVGCLGNDEVRTPNIDRLASEGLTLENTFANSPVCCPARATLLTGQYIHRNGMVANDLRLRESSVSFARTLATAGYRTGFVGKWHLDGGPRLPGYVPPGDRRQGFEFWAGNQCSHTHFRNWYYRDSAERIYLDTFETEGYADVGIEFLRKTKQDPRPFYLTVQWGPPHDPYKAPAHYSKMYDPARIRMRPNWREAGAGTRREDIAEYYGMVTAVDDAVGKILRALDDLGLRENTIVLFSSDHGDMLGSQASRLKRKPWEESIRVPGIMRWPGKLKPGSKTTTIFTHVDFAPTLLGMAGLDAPREMQGQNLAPVLLTGKGRAEDSAYFEICVPYAGDGTEGAWRGVRTERHMYARYKDRPWVLYDLAADPFQQTNLAGQSAARGLQEEMERRLRTWMEKTGDSWDNCWTDPVEDAGRLYRHGVFYTIDEYRQWAKRVGA